MLTRGVSWGGFGVMEHPQIAGLSGWRPLARGDLAVVWEARHLALDRLVAVKVYQPELAEGTRRCFVREAAAAGRLSGHGGILTVHGAGILTDDRPYLVMELCPGGSLDQWLQSQNRPTAERVRQVGIRIADALAAVHACGLLHRDIKPANVLIDRFGNPRLADFRLAVLSGTKDAAAIGLGITPAYAPPEAFWMQQATEAGDVFSLAATLYALLAGSPPRGDGAAVTVEQMFELANIPIEPIPGVEPCLMGVLMTALSIDSAARPTAAGIRNQLASVPAQRVTTQWRPVAAGAAKSSDAPRVPWKVPELSTVPTSNRLGVPAATAQPQQAHGQVASAKAPPRQGKRREGMVALVAAALIAVVGSSTVWLISEPATQSAQRGGGSSSAAPSGAPEPKTTRKSTSDTGDQTGSSPAVQETIRLKGTAESARPWQTVPIKGTYIGGAGTVVRVQRWEAGKWLAFPLVAKTDQSGHFRAFVELGRPSRYRLRVMDPRAGVKSEPFALEIRG